MPKISMYLQGLFQNLIMINSIANTLLNSYFINLLLKQKILTFNSADEHITRSFNCMNFLHVGEGMAK